MKNLFEIGSAIDKDETEKGWRLIKDGEDDLAGEGDGLGRGAKNSPLSPKSHLLHTKIEKRKGKTVTMVGVFFLSKEDLLSLLGKLKKTLATGGTINENYLEFQGNLVEKVKDCLIKEGFKFKK